MATSCDTVCKDQETFNKALDTYQTVKEVELEEDMKKNRGMISAALVIMLLLLIWAVTLALRVQDSEHRVLHVFLALLTSPLYIISHFLSNIPMRR